MSNKPVIGITMGDPSGIGPEVTLKAISQLGRGLTGRIVVIGNSLVLSRLRDFQRRNFDLVDLDNVTRADFAYGKISPIFGNASIAYLDQALELLREGRISGLVTAPVSKEAINLTGRKFSGHTEYLANKTKTRKFAMMFVADKLKITLVTRHIPLKQVCAKINAGNIQDAISLTVDFLKKYYHISHPRIAVCGLNPHAGEGGLLGKEEEMVIKPAIEKAKRYSRFIFGPFAGDTIFLKAAAGGYDAVIAMYHDQGMIPLKVLAFNSGVNVTIGLPFIRTSPCHGTAFDIAGKNKADASSMLSAIKLTACLCQKSV
jgi:4-phospho-D-threonate 3-dehydrogenase / 4-phospho-D-erythronate 3-dehydrogenase